VRELIRGFKYPLQGFSLITKPGIRLFVIIPLLINTLLFSTVIAVGAHEIVNFSNWLSARWQWAEWITWLLWPLFAILAFSVVFYCFTLVANLVAAPSNGFLAGAVVRYLTGGQQQPNGGWSRLPGEITVAISNELRKLLYFGIWAVPLILLFLIPMVNAVAPFVWLLFCSWLLAMEYLDFPMSNHGLAFPEIRHRLGQRKGLVLGFGLGVMVLTLIPVLNFLAMPIAVTSASKLWVHELKPPGNN